MEGGLSGVVEPSEMVAAEAMAHTVRFPVNLDLSADAFELAARVADHDSGVDRECADCQHACMYPRILKRLRDLVMGSEYVVTIHAYDEMAADDLTVWDVESTFITGEILERQKDAMTGESKYRVRGKSLDGASVEVIAKLAITGKLVIITVYAL